MYNNWNNTKIYDFTILNNLGNQSTNGEGQLNRPQLYWRLRNEKRTIFFFFHNFAIYKVEALSTKFMSGGLYLAVLLRCQSRHSLEILTEKAGIWEIEFIGYL